MTTVTKMKYILPDHIPSLKYPITRIELHPLKQGPWIYCLKICKKRLTYHIRYQIKRKTILTHLSKTLFLLQKIFDRNVFHQHVYIYAILYRLKYNFLNQNHYNLIYSYHQKLERYLQSKNFNFCYIHKIKFGKKDNRRSHEYLK